MNLTLVKNNEKMFFRASKVVDFVALNFQYYTVASNNTKSQKSDVHAGHISTI